MVCSYNQQGEINSKYYQIVNRDDNKINNMNREFFYFYFQFYVWELFRFDYGVQNISQDPRFTIWAYGEEYPIFMSTSSVDLMFSMFKIEEYRIVIHQGG